MILLWVVLHWYVSIFFQTFFLHRYASHSMFSMSKAWERFFFIATWLGQGSSYLNARVYAVMHRLHHKHSDRKKDPHSPYYYTNVITMMLKTYKMYKDLLTGKVEEKQLEANVPRWNRFEKFADNNFVRASFVVVYALPYLFYAPSLWYLVLLPVHGLMGPIHGAIVNWCGHKYGYRNYQLDDRSKNTTPFDFITLGELMQNNHHQFPNRRCFATRWFEVDLGYLFICLLEKLRIISFPAR